MTGKIRRGHIWRIFIEGISAGEYSTELSLHIVIYRIQENFKEEIDSLSLPMLKWKIMNLDNK